MARARINPPAFGNGHCQYTDSSLVQMSEFEWEAAMKHSGGPARLPAPALKPTNNLVGQCVDGGGERRQPLAAGSRPDAGGQLPDRPSPLPVALRSGPWV